jgi:hypothetical protein
MAKMPVKALAERLAVIRPALRVLYTSGYAQPSRDLAATAVGLLLEPLPSILTTFSTAGFDS